MKLVFANGASVKAMERLVLRGGRWSRISLAVRYGVVIHPEHGLVLIDTGYTKATTEGPGRSPFLRFYSNVLRPEIHEDLQPACVVGRLGYSVEDVRWIIVTHFHADHVSGLGQFPNAQVVASSTALATIRNRSVFANVRHGIFPELLPDDLTERLVPIEDCRPTDPGFGLPLGRDIFGDGKLIAVDLPGHAEGHCGSLVATKDGPVFYAVDTQWMLDALTAERTPGYPSRLIASDTSALDQSTRTVALAQRQGLRVVLCHDPEVTEFDL